MVIRNVALSGRGLGLLAIGCSLVLLAGCDEADAVDTELASEHDEELDDTAEEEPDAEEPRGAVNNGFQLNGFQLNGFQLNGFQLNGFQLNGVDNGDDSIAITEVKLKGFGNVVDTWLDEGNLHVQTDMESVLSGDELVDTRITFDVVEGDKKGKKIQINNVKEIAPGLLVYDIELKVEYGPWNPLCYDTHGLATEAILVGSVWSSVTASRIHEASEGLVTFACRDAAIAKCVEFGYRPWAEVEGVSLSDLHQSCTRMVRADYCGDSVSHTLNGTGIHVVDQVGIQSVDPDVSYVVEAEWGPDGATCLNSANTRLAGEVAGCQLPACGSDFASGGLLQSGKITGP